MRAIAAATIYVFVASCASAQVYSPKVLLRGQPDASDLRALAQSIYDRADANTPRERAEAVWRFFLTDGRFVKPGFWYHIAGWAYEEPEGEVLDPLKLLNSYGFGLCYHIAPLLEAVWKAGGFEDARVWFLTGHTVAEVFYEGAYHYYDSDMMGYNAVGRGRPPRSLPVASVHQIEQDGGIILSKLKSPTEVNPALVDAPWYPADVREAAIDGLAELFTTTADNHLFPWERAPQGHRMGFEMHAGERMVRYFHPEPAGLAYLPYKFTGSAWEEFPQEVAAYQIKTADGPQSQKDGRKWATGVLEQRVPGPGEFEVHSPYVIIDAQFEFDAPLAEAKTARVETSTDGGQTWLPAGEVTGPRAGAWRIEPAVLTRSAHGRRTAVSGVYDYRVRVAGTNGGVLRTRFQLNPRTLPELAAGRNELIYTAGTSSVRRDVPAEPVHTENARYASDGGQGYLVPRGDGAAELVFHLSSPLSAFDAGGRFLDLSRGLAPDKFTAEVRKVAPLDSSHAAASIAWSRSPEGPFESIWEYDPAPTWKDGVAIDRTLRWPEVDRHVALEGTRDVYVRYRFRGLGLDSIRLSTERHGQQTPGVLEVTHTWKEDGKPKTYTLRVPAGTQEMRYAIEIPSGVEVANESISFQAK